GDFAGNLEAEILYLSEGEEAPQSTSNLDQISAESQEKSQPLQEINQDEQQEQQAEYQENEINQPNQQPIQQQEVIQDRGALEEEILYKKGTIEITVNSIKDITFIEDNGERRIPENLSMKIILDDQEGTTNPVVYDTQQGQVEINEFFQFEFDPNETKWRNLKLQILEGGGNDQEEGNPFGAVEIPFGEINVEVLYKPEDAQQLEQGQQQEFIQESVQKQQQPIEEIAKIDDDCPKGIVEVTIFGVKNVAAMDSNGKSDPYIKVTVGGITQKTQKKKD
ncbi:MAG: hypothetical protein EZS28_041446, partial [Streblomastix strix]